MFKSTTTNGNGQKTHNAPSNLQSNNSLVQGTRIEGNVFTESDIRIDGKLIGSLNSKGKVIIGPSGQIEGEIHCANAVVEGRFSGTLVATELLQIKESAHVEGDINTNKLIVQSGSTFNVNCKMGGQKIKELKGKKKSNESNGSTESEQLTTMANVS